MEEKMAEEEKSENESSGSSEIVEAVVDKAIELDEKTQKRRLTLLNLALQDVKMIDICEEEGINPRDTFRGFVSDEEGRKRLRIVTLGEEGEKKAKEMITALGDCDEWRVKNESVFRVEWKDVEEIRKKKESDGKEEMVTVYPGLRLPKKEVEETKKRVAEMQKRAIREANEESKRAEEELKRRVKNG